MSRPADDHAVHFTLRTAAVFASALIVMYWSSGCKQQHSEQRVETSAPASESPSDSASAIPATVPPDNAEPASVAGATNAETDRVITVRAVIASLPTEYSAAFSANQLRVITETRAAAGRRAPGRYEFYGARLTRYSGELLLAPAAVDLAFDLQGVLLTRQTALTAREVETIKTRGQLLRSHALAQQATRLH